MYRAIRPFQEALASGSRRLRAEIRHVWKSFHALRDFDLLIVSGGGQLDDYWGGPWGHPYSLLKWGLIAKATGTRFVFMSVGACAIGSPMSSLFMRHALRLAAYRSYRDQTSKELLGRMAFIKDDPVCADLAFSFTPRESLDQSTVAAGVVIGISPIAYLSEQWPKERALYAEYIEKLASFAGRLLHEGLRLCLFATDAPDALAIAHLTESLTRHGLSCSQDTVRLVRAETVHDLMSHIAALDYVVASRLHGVLLSHLMNKPVLAISYDRKVTTYMTEMEQPEYCLDIHGIDGDSLMTALGTLVSQRPKILPLLRSKADFFRSALQAQYDAVLGSHYC